MSSKTECTNLKGKEKLLQELQSLSQELYDMREDDRDSHNQILQVFSATGTVLAVFFGGGFLFESNGSGNSEAKGQSLFEGAIGNSFFKKALSNYLSKQRVLFLFVCIVFIIAITYCLKLTIANKMVPLSRPLPQILS